MATYITCTRYIKWSYHFFFTSFFVMIYFKSELLLRIRVSFQSRIIHLLSNLGLLKNIECVYILFNFVTKHSYFLSDKHLIFIFILLIKCLFTRRDIRFKNKYKVASQSKETLYFKMIKKEFCKFLLSKMFP